MYVIFIEREFWYVEKIYSYISDIYGAYSWAKRRSSFWYCLRYKMVSRTSALHDRKYDTCSVYFLLCEKSTLMGKGKACYRQILHMVSRKGRAGRSEITRKILEERGASRFYSNVLFRESVDSSNEWVKELAEGGGNFFDGWMKNPHSAMISCNDGFRPVSFLVEAID